jgi:hypothetical protein
MKEAYAVRRTVPPSAEIAVEEEFDTWLGRARYEPRHVQTAEGELVIEIPQVREAAAPFVSKRSRSGIASGCCGLTR